jgi:hypothetical protein
MALFGAHRNSMLKKRLTPPTLSEMAIFHQFSTRLALPLPFNRQHLAAKNPHPDQRDAKEDALVQPS